jgi:hypothetical protein
VGWLKKEPKGWTCTKRGFPPAKLRMATEKEVESLRNAAEKCVEVIERAIGIRLDYSQESLSKLDDLIEVHWAGMDPPEGFKGEIVVMGAFLGECINRNFGSHWVFDESNQWFGVEKEDVATVSPFNKVEKRFYEGRSHCLETLYEFFESQSERTAG